MSIVRARIMGVTEKGDSIVSVKVYHGSPNNFVEFDYQRIGTQGSSEGHGFYFTTDLETAKHYAENGWLYEADFHGTKPLSLEELTIDKDTFRKILEEIHKSGNDYLSNWGDIDFDGYETALNYAVDGMYYEGPGANDVDLVAGLINSAGSAELVYRMLYEKFGFDHIPAHRESDHPDHTVYVATVKEAFTITKVTKFEI